MRRIKEVRVRDLMDVCDSLTSLSSDIHCIYRKAKNTNTKTGLLFIAGLIFGVITQMQIRNMEQRLNDTYENTKVQDQLDAQEKKILQLELELEDLRKKE